jgi:hypothetical protein
MYVCMIIIQCNSIQLFNSRCPIARSRIPDLPIHRFSLLHHFVELLPILPFYREEGGSWKRPSREKMKVNEKITTSKI